MEGGLGTVETYQFEPEASDSQADTEAAGDDDSGDKERLHW